MPTDRPSPSGARPTTIAVDAMGGDNAPGEIVAGAAAAAAERDIGVVLAGRPGQLRPLLASYISASARRVQAGRGAGWDGAQGGRARPLAERVKIATAEDAIAMDEGALASWRRPRSSVAIACQLVRRGQAGAAGSAGSARAVASPPRA